MPDSYEYIASLDDVKIGKNVLESLTRSAYDDCRCILREYVQNAADQIDIARDEHLSENDDYAIYVNINKDERKIIIEDDATGVMEKEVLPVLRNVACSQKKRGLRKGFRGIGRLGGLGYCTTLTFVTSFKGEPNKSILVWHASEMSRIIDNEADERSASEVVAAVTELKTESEKVDKHYFRIILDEVNDERLLDVADIKNYLSMVAPVEISSSFNPFTNTIKEFMREHSLTLDTYDLFVNNDPVNKQYTRSIYDENGSPIDEVKKVECFIRNDSNGNPFYWGWYSVCKLEGMLKFKNIARGIRLRCKNIQLGGEGNCRRFLPGKQDQRFSDYFFGEIHVLSESLIPDMDRNYLRVDAARTEFERMATEDFAALKKLCYDASGYKSDYNKIETARKKEEKLQEKKKNKEFSSKEELEKEQKEFEQSLREAEKARRSMEKRKQQLADSPLAGIIDTAYSPTHTLVPHSEQNSSVGVLRDIASEGSDMTVHEPTSYLRTDKPIYGKYNKHTKDVINTVYRVIGDLLPMEAMKEALIARIEEELTK